MQVIRVFEKVAPGSGGRVGDGDRFGAFFQFCFQVNKITESLLWHSPWSRCTTCEPRRVLICAWYHLDIRFKGIYMDKKRRIRLYHIAWASLVGRTQIMSALFRIRTGRQVLAVVGMLRRLKIIVKGIWNLDSSKCMLLPHNNSE